MLWLPSAKLEVEKTATPSERVCVPRAVVPSRKVTVPAGVPVAGARGDTVAVMVTGPAGAGLPDEAIVTAAGSRMTSITAGDATPEKALSPEYDAVMV